jgi:hypothetical protein
MSNPKIKENLAQIEVFLGYEQLEERVRAELRIARIRLLLMLSWTGNNANKSAMA